MQSANAQGPGILKRFRDAGTKRARPRGIGPRSSADGIVTGLNAKRYSTARRRLPRAGAIEKATASKCCVMVAYYSFIQGV